MESRDEISRLSARKTKRDIGAREKWALFKFLGRVENSNENSREDPLSVSRSYKFISVGNESRKCDNTRLPFLVVSLSSRFLLFPLARNYARSPPLCPFNGIKVR